MEREGFDVLDSIDSQEKFIEWWDAVQTIESGSRIHDICLVEPLLLCGKQNDAEYEISISFIQGVDSYVSYLEHVECAGIGRDDIYEQRIRNSSRNELTLWRWCIGRNQKELQKYISENYSRNMAWVQQHGIPTDLMTQPRTLLNI